MAKVAVGDLPKLNEQPSNSQWVWTETHCIHFVAAYCERILAFPETAPCSLGLGFPWPHIEQHFLGTHKKAEKYKQTPSLESVSITIYVSL